MSTLSSNFDIVYERYHTRPFAGQCDVRETEAADTGREVRRLRFKNVDGYEIPHMMVKRSSNVYGSPSEAFEKSRFRVVRKDCDGLFVVENENGLRMNICELKTSASVNTICDAKDQIIGSYVRMNALMSNLKSYPEHVDVVGFIASHGPNLHTLSMMKDASDPKTMFYYKLMTKGEYVMPKVKMDGYYNPIKMREIKFYFVTVPDGAQHHEVDYMQYA